MIPTLIEGLVSAAGARRSRPAIVFGTDVWSYDRLLTSAHALADELTAAGAAGRRVAIDIGSEPSHIVGILGTHLAGATSVPLDDKWTADQARQRLDLCEVSFVLGASDGSLRVDRHADGRVVAAPDVPFLLAPTGGTTGVPKAIVISERATLARFMTQAVEFGFSSATRHLSATPLFHGGGRSFVLSQLYFGGSVDMHPRFDTEAFTVALRDVDLAFVVPTMLQRLARHGDAGRSTDRATLLISGAPVRDEASALLARVGISRAHDYYASVEAGPISIRSVRRLGDEFGDSHLAFGVRLLGLPDDIPPEGAVVEGVAVASHAVADGIIELDGPHPYEVLDGGAHVVRMSDRVRIGPDLSLAPQGRTDDVILSGGVNIFPSEVEKAVRSLDGVVDACVVGIPDDEWGQVVAAAVVADRDLDPADLTARLRGRLTGPQLPRTYLFVESLPLTSVGKTDRRRLEGLLTERARS
jgi:acyl-CoA synthetase (AMP-forming)/AMP-acid ligase II